MLRSVLYNMYWPEQQWPRQLLLGLREFNFSTIPKNIADDLHGFCTSFLHTKCVEDVNREVRAAEDRVNNKKLSRKMRWEACLLSPVLPDCDRP